MLTWRVHRTLDDPLKRDPISWRGYETRFGKFVPHAEPRLNRFKPLVTAALLVVFSPMIGMALLLIFFPSPLLALLASILFGMHTVERLSGYIGSEHRRHTYELLCALPYGKLGVHWVYATYWFRATSFTRMILRVPLMLGLAASPFLFGGWALPLTGQRAVEFWFADTLAFGVFLVYDYFNTRVVATLIAMLTPALTTKPRTIYALSLGAFMLIQVGTYLLGAFVALALLPLILIRLHVPPFAFVVIMPITAVVVIAFREIVTRWLWRQIGITMQTTRAELDLLIR